MNAIYGLTGFRSLSSAALQSSLESRLRAATASDGSILYKLTWKQRATPSGRQICALRASGARTSASDFTLLGWPSPCVVEPNTDPEKVWARKQRLTAKTGVYRGNDCGLGSKVQLLGWPTTTRDHKDGEECLNVPLNSLLGREVWLAGWCSPMTQDHSRGNKEARPHDTGVPLSQQVVLAGWPTATSKEAAGGEYSDPEKALARVQGPHANDLRDFARIALPMRLCSDGTLLTGSTAGMESGGRLNPEHSRWLMRIPAEWASCAPTATRSTPKRQRRSVKSSAASWKDYNL